MSKIALFDIDQAVGVLCCCVAVSENDPNYVEFSSRHPSRQELCVDDISPDAVNKSIAKSLWVQFGNIPVDDDGVMEESWQHFEVGSNREDVWHWFEAELNVSVYQLMYGEK